MHNKVVILGAGPTGLSCAWKLTQNNIEVEVIEKEGLVGGISATFPYNGMSLDLGPHRFTPHTEEVLSIVKDICGEDLKLREQKIKVYLKGKYFDYPFQAKELLTGLSPHYPVWFLFSYLGSLLQSIINPGKDEKTYKDWVIKRFGKGLYDTCFRPIASKTWGMDPSKISSTIARQRISLPSLGKMIMDIVRQLLGLKKKHTITNPIFPEGYFYYPENGIGQICEGFAKQIELGGGKIRLFSQPEIVHIDNGKIHSVTVASSEGRKKTECDFVMSTIPLSQLIACIRPENENNVMDNANQLEFRSIILLFLVAKKNKISDNIAIFYPEEEFVFGRISEQKNFSKVMIPEDKTVLCAEITCRVGDGIWGETDEQLFTDVISNLGKADILQRKDVEKYFTRRIKYSYPLYDLNFQTRLNTVLKYISGIENLITNGRSGLFKYNNLHHSIEMGILAAKHILSGKQKSEVWEPTTLIFDNYCMVE